MHRKNHVIIAAYHLYTHRAESKKGNSHRSNKVWRTPTTTTLTRIINRQSEIQGIWPFERVLLSCDTIYFKNTKFEYKLIFSHENVFILFWIHQKWILYLYVVIMCLMLYFIEMWWTNCIIFIYVYKIIAQHGIHTA